MGLGKTVQSITLLSAVLQKTGERLRVSWRGMYWDTGCSCLLRKRGDHHDSIVLPGVRVCAAWVLGLWRTHVQQCLCFC